MGVMAHYVGADMLHAPYVVFDAYGPACKGRVGRSEYNRKQSEHFAKASQFVRSIHLYKHLADDAGAFRASMSGLMRASTKKQEWFFTSGNSKGVIVFSCMDFLMARMQIYDNYSIQLRKYITMSGPNFATVK